MYKRNIQISAEKVCPAHLYGHQTCWADQQSTGHPPRRCKIIQNAGTSLIGEMGETVKSLLLTIYVFDIKEIFIVGHYDCGVALTSSKDILHNMRSRGVSEQQLKLIEKIFKFGLILTPTPPKMYLQSLKNLRQILLFPMIYLSTDLSLTPIRVNLIFWQMAIKRLKTNRAPCF